MTQAPAVRLPVGDGPKLPPASPLPPALGALAFVASRRRTVMWLSRSLGRSVTVRIPVFGDAMVVCDPALAKQVFATSPDVLHNIQPNLSRILGAGSVFGLEGAAHRRRRKLLTPPFHGKSIKAYEDIVEEETRREMAAWPDGVEFASLEPMMRITLNIILRAVFGADGAELQQLRELLPKWVTLGSRLSALPSPKGRPRRFSPWARLAAYRREYDGLVDNLIAGARRDPHFEDRADVLSLFLRSTYDDGTAMTRAEDAAQIGLNVVQHVRAGGEDLLGQRRVADHHRITEHRNTHRHAAADAAVEPLHRASARGHERQRPQGARQWRCRRQFRAVPDRETDGGCLCHRILSASSLQPTGRYPERTGRYPAGRTKANARGKPTLSSRALRMSSISIATSRPDDGS